jgi:hypothetical protein
MRTIGLDANGASNLSHMLKHPNEQVRSYAAAALRKYIVHPAHCPIQ